MDLSIPVPRNFENYNRHPLDEKETKKLGIDPKTLRLVETLEDLRKDVPMFVIAKCNKATTFIQNKFKVQTLKRKDEYVMSLGTYIQLRKNPDTNEIILVPSKIKFRDRYKPYRGQDLNKKTLLVTRTGGCGDLLFIKPCLDYLKAKYPKCFIKFACGPQYQAMVETWSCIDELLDLPFNAKELILCDYHALFEGVIERTKEAHNENAYILFSKWLNLPIPPEQLVPKQNPKPSLIVICKEILEKWGIKENEFIFLQMRASSPIRSPSPTFWREIINRLIDKGYNIILTDSPDYSDQIDKFIKSTSKPEKVFNFSQFSKTLAETIAMASLSQLCLSTDSSLIHIGASLDKKIFGIYGPFPGKVRLTTYKNVDWVDSNLFCAPCFKHGHLPCPNSINQFSTCYEKLDKDLIIDRIEKLIKK